MADPARAIGHASCSQEGMTCDFQSRPVLHVLIVDDEPCLTAVVADILAEDGYRVSVAHDGLAAFRAAMQDRPTLVLADIKMPGGDGLSMLRSFKDEVALRDVPVVFFSSSPDQRDARRLGADGFIQKPAGRAELLQGVFEGVCAGFMRPQQYEARTRAHRHLNGHAGPAPASLPSCGCPTSAVA
jgi:CheY-like chemotaxis protein